MKAMLMNPITFVALMLYGNLANAGLIVLDFDAATPGTLLTAPLSEDGFTFTVSRGHYDINGNFTTDGDGRDAGPFAFGIITLAKDDGGLFNVESLVVSGLSGPSHSFIAVGNTGNVFAPGAPGTFVFGDDFHSVSAFVIRQTSVGILTFDDLTLNTPMPLPGTALLFLLGLVIISPRRITATC